MNATPSNAAIAARDLAVVWHPCTQMQDHERLPLVPIARGEGVWLYDFEGKRYLDGISSWWVNLFGHANPRINAAVREQARTARARAARRLHARAGRRAVRSRWCSIAARRAHALLLRRQRLRGRRGRGQDELPLLAEPRPAAKAALRDALEQLSRRDARRARGRRRRALQEGVPAAADGRDHGPLARLPRARAGRELGGAQPADVRRRWRRRSPRRRTRSRR